MIADEVSSGRAYNKFIELVKNQNGDTSYIEDTTKFEKSSSIIPILAIEERIY